MIAVLGNQDCNNSFFCLLQHIGLSVKSRTTKLSFKYLIDLGSSSILLEPRSSIFKFLKFPIVSGNFFNSLKLISRLIKLINSPISFGISFNLLLLKLFILG